MESNIKDQAIKNLLKDWIVPIIAAVVMVFLMNRFLFFNVYVPTESMVPTIKPDDKMVVTRIYNTNNIKRGNIIVFYSNELSKTLIKRVIGLPGDHIVIHDGIVNVNGENIKEDYVKNNMKYDGIFDVPENNFFFLGDNRSNSADSRVWINSYIDKDSIKGKAVFRFYPFDRLGSLK